MTLGWLARSFTWLLAYRSDNIREKAGLPDGVSAGQQLEGESFDADQWIT